MAPAMATKRLREELIKLKTEPPPGIIAEPDESNILKWFYVIRGPSDTPFDGGVYIGKLIFPSEYPMKAPSIYMLTPSGRFQINTKICMSMSDFHPESWNPMWSVATIIQGVQSFMASEELTTGGLKASEADRKKFAKLSVGYNQTNYPGLFDGDIPGALEEAQRACEKAEGEHAKTSNDPKASRRSRRANPKEGSAEPEGSEHDAEKSSNAKKTDEDKKPSLSRRGRRLAKKAESMGPEEASDPPSNREGANENQESNDGPAADETPELSPAEIEKRRKRNAKKRAKQKAKKSAAAAATSQETDA